jgi:putative transposase
VCDSEEVAHDDARPERSAGTGPGGAELQRPRTQPALGRRHSHLKTTLVLQALEMALGQRRPTAVIHHSDQGTQGEFKQYTSIAFGIRCKQAGVRPSMGSVGDAYDNAMCESFFATLECELLERERFRNQAEAKMKVFDFIEGWYNPRRRHSALGYKSPMEFERAHAAVAA